MIFSTEPLTPVNLSRCAPFWADRAALSPQEFEELLARVAWLLEHDRAIGVIAYAGREPRAYGVSVFVSHAEAEEIVASRRARIGARLLLDAGFPNVVLSHDEVGERNASGEGLELLVASVQYLPDLGFGQEILGTMMKAFMDSHQGYRLRRVLCESFGDASIAALTASGSYTMTALFEEDGRPSEPRSELGLLTRDTALKGTVGLLPMFVYTPPVVRYTRPEQRLLKAALSGATDETVRSTLGVTLTAIKSRWLRIQERTARRLPLLFDDVAQGGPSGARGVQTRHIVLDYVRRTPSELTPYDGRFEPDT